jgi:hypothetical protein
MRTFVITSGFAAALLLTSFVTRHSGDGVLPVSGATISTLDLTIASGALTTSEYADAN